VSIDVILFDLRSLLELRMEYLLSEYISQCFDWFFSAHV